MTDKHPQSGHAFEATRQAFAETFRQLIPHLEDFTLYSRGQLTELAKEKALLAEGQGPFFLVILDHLLRLGHFRDADGSITIKGQRVDAWYGMRWKIALWDGSIWAKTG